MLVEQNHWGHVFVEMKEPCGPWKRKRREDLHKGHTSGFFIGTLRTTPIQTDKMSSLIYKRKQKEWLWLTEEVVAISVDYVNIVNLFAITRFGYNV